MKPDMTLESSLGQKTFNGSSSFGGRTFVTRPYSARSFLARTFLTGTSGDAAKRPTFGKYSFPATEFQASQAPVRESGRAVETQTVGVKDSREAQRPAVEVRESRDADRTYLRRGKSQDIFDQRDEAQHRKLSIDDVRELLNKSK